MNQEINYQFLIKFNKTVDIIKVINKISSLYNTFNITEIKEKSFKLEITTEYNIEYDRIQIKKDIFRKLLTTIFFDKLEPILLKEEREIYETA